jgi:hydroxymethylbilane synthase
VSRTITIATRGSALALWQAEHLKARLLGVDPSLTISFNVITTQGDKILDVPLAKVGGKGLFVKEIEQALLDGKADIAVHSMKDVPAELEAGLVLSAVSTREVPWDALCAREPVTLDTLPHGATVGTSSMRRPDLKIAMLRGNVPTRIRKLDDKEFDAIVLAAAGLTRLGMADRITQLLTLDYAVPAVAQGVLGLETRADAAPELLAVLRAAIHDAAEERRVAAERTFLLRMGGSCQTPLAAHAVDEAGELKLLGLCGMPDGTRILRGDVRGPASDAERLGAQLADDLLARGAAEILAATK